MSKGISSIISIILLLMIVIAFTAAFFIFSSRMFSSTQNQASESINRTAGSMQLCLKFESASANNIYVRNCGTNTIQNNTLSLYVDSSLVLYSITNNINPDEVGTITILQALAAGNHEVKVSGAGYDIIENVWISGGSVTTTLIFTTTTQLTTTTVLSTTTTTECFGAESCNPTGNMIGGGNGYNSIILQNDPRVKYVVSTKDQLISALNNASPGEVIYIPENARINMSGTWGHIKSGVILASNRGSNGSLGGTIFKSDGESETSHTPMFYISGNNTRVTGLRLSGGRNSTTIGVPLLYAIDNHNYRGLEVDNNEISGWTGSGVLTRIEDPYLIQLSFSSFSAIAYIHHNYFHHDQCGDSGYGVQVGGGSALIEANIFDYTRHAIAGGGFPTESYEARYNIHLGHTTSHSFDVHQYPYAEPPVPGAIAGNTYIMHHNTFYLLDLDHNEDEAICIRGVPTNGAWIYNNILQWKGYVHNPPVTQRYFVGNISMTMNLIGMNQVLYPGAVIYTEYLV